MLPACLGKQRPDLQSDCNLHGGSTQEPVSEDEHVFVEHMLCVMLPLQVGS
jgi:hypothetical protein